MTVVLLCGIPSETPLAMVRTELVGSGTPHVTFNQRSFAEADMSYELSGGELHGYLRVGQVEHRLQDLSAAFVRLMDDRFLPELSAEPPGSALRNRCRQVHDALIRWLEIAPGRIVNRYGAMGSNGSKPYQAQLITKYGFRTPPTLVTNDPAAVLAFRRTHGRVVYKSTSGVRSIVSELTDEELARLDRVTACPTQFQAYVEGDNVRVHVVGQDVYATAVSCDALDYRYPRGSGAGPAALTAIDLPGDIAERAIELTADLGLAFAGLDLMIEGDGSVYCFEVNPSPAFSYYQQHTGQPIARSVAAYLTGVGRASA